MARPSQELTRHACRTLEPGLLPRLRVRSRVAVRPWVHVALSWTLAACASARTPPVIEAELAKSAPGTVTVVEFVDYQCPFCRALDRELSAVLREHAGQVRVVHKQVPLRRHTQARDAARAEVCAEAAGRGDAMHAALMSAPELSVQSIADIGRRLSLDVDSLARCMNGAAAESRIRADEADFDAIGGSGVPTVFIGRRMFVGLTSSEELSAAIEGELRAR